MTISVRTLLLRTLLLASVCVEISKEIQSAVTPVPSHFVCLHLSLEIGFTVKSVLRIPNSFQFSMLEREWSFFPSLRF